MGPDLFKRWMDMLFWWLPRDDDASRGGDDKPQAEQRQKPDEETPSSTQEPRAADQAAAASKTTATAPEPEPAPKPEAPAEPEAKAEPKPTPESTPKPAAGGTAAKADDAPVDDLTAIKGIGPAMAARLQDLGIRTFDDLAAADVKAVTQKLRDQSVVISEKKVEGWSVSAREMV